MTNIVSLYSTRFIFTDCSLNSSKSTMGSLRQQLARTNYLIHTSKQFGRAAISTMGGFRGGRGLSMSKIINPIACGTLAKGALGDGGRSSTQGGGVSPNNVNVSSISMS